MQHTKRARISVALLAAAALGVGQPVRSQVPATIAGILCDTEVQVRAIVSANLQSSDAMRAAYQRFHAELNAKHEPACAIQEVPHMLLSVPQSIDIGPWPQNGQVLEAFILHIQLDSLDAWFMYLAPRDLSPGTFPNGI